MKLLLIEDEIRMAQALIGILRLENYEVDHCGDGVSGLQSIESGVYDIIILDIMLPGMNGFDVTKQARKKGVRTPILMLTAKGDLEDKVEGLDSGADDYLTKPFKTQELLARLRALARRSIHSPDGSLSFGDIRLDMATSTLICTANEQSVRLSEKEFRILEYLISNQGQILRREQLAVKIWGFDSDAEYNNVEVYMSFTRKKLAFVGSRTEIKAVRGIGYELRCAHV
ncbi:MAG: response regulator transcription factor [Clostridiales bacterium]|nr:response regulator transcription factor [Clostridiales bacterium]MCD8133639.1 response regulator transcription factor [Clostridiales bacterium]